MYLAPLPAQVVRLLEALHAPPRLVAHLRLVHDVAKTIISRIDQAWSNLVYDRRAVLMGAATHDIGKIIHPEELTHPGHEHEKAGEALLKALGVSEQLARSARTHSQWADEPQGHLEDYLVALADTLWRGKRDERLEEAISKCIVAQTHQAQWHVFLTLDAIATSITAEADRRLAWQNQHPLS